MKEFKNIDEIKLAHRNFGGYFFEKSTMQWWDSRVGRTVYGGRYFVTSERMDFSCARRYTVRMIDENRMIKTIGEFGQYATPAQAKSAIMKLLIGPVDSPEMEQASTRYSDDPTYGQFSL